MLLRVVRVSGWSGPRTRSWSGSSAVNSCRRLRASPACPVQSAMLLRVVRVSGWSGPRTRSWSGSSAVNSAGAAGVPGRARSSGDVAAGGQGAGVVGAEDPLLVGQQRGEQRQRAAASPACPVQAAMLLRVVRVSGWSGPRTRSRSGSSAVINSSAAAAVPGLPGPVGDVVAGGQGVGVVGAEDPLLVGQQRGEQLQCAAGVPGLPGPAGDVAAGGQGAEVVGAESLKEIPVPGLPQREVVCRCWEFRQRRQCRLRLPHGP